MRQKVLLFENASKCCGCTVCYNICPQQAIQMTEGKYYFSIPQIDYDKCISCGACIRACDFQRLIIPRNKAIKIFATKTSEENDLLRAASGGAFIGIAGRFIDAGGVVVGSSLITENGRLVPKHIIVKNRDELYSLQGSKYVQSSIKDVLKEVKRLLLSGNNVLFSGTPCQVAAVKSFTGNRFENLFTIDIICHGVPSDKMFADYLSVIEKKNNGTVIDYKFRDKSSGWGMKGSYVIRKKDGQEKKKYFPSQLSSYFQLFLDSYTYRDSCYNCPYAGENRVGDITIGDYWGIDSVHPEFLRENGGVFEEKKGISCLLVSTQKGIDLLTHYGADLILMESNWESVSKKNAQLKTPSKYPSDRSRIMNLYEEKGYEKVDSDYQKSIGFKKVYYLLWNLVPYNIQKKIRKQLKKRV